MNIGNDIRRIRVEPLTLPITIDQPADHRVTDPRADEQCDPNPARSGEPRSA